MEKKKIFVVSLILTNIVRLTSLNIYFEFSSKVIIACAFQPMWRNLNKLCIVWELEWKANHLKTKKLTLKCKFHMQTCECFESWTNVQDTFSFSTKSCNYSHLQKSCFIFPLVIILLTTKKNLHLSLLPSLYFCTPF